MYVPKTVIIVLSGLAATVSAQNTVSVPGSTPQNLPNIQPVPRPQPPQAPAQPPPPAPKLPPAAAQAPPKGPLAPWHGQLDSCRKIGSTDQDDNRQNCFAGICLTLSPISEKERCFDAANAPCSKRTTIERRDTCFANRGQCQEIQLLINKEPCFRKNPNTRPPPGPLGLPRASSPQSSPLAWGTTTQPPYTPPASVAALPPRQSNSPGRANGNNPFGALVAPRPSTSPKPPPPRPTSSGLPLPPPPRTSSSSSSSNNNRPLPLAQLAPRPGSGNGTPQPPPPRPGSSNSTPQPPPPRPVSNSNNSNNNNNARPPTGQCNGDQECFDRSLCEYIQNNAKHDECMYKKKNKACDPMREVLSRDFCYACTKQCNRISGATNDSKSYKSGCERGQLAPSC